MNNRIEEIAAIDAQYDRLPPHDADVEFAAVASLLMASLQRTHRDEELREHAKKVIAEIRSAVSAEDFFLIDCQVIFRVMTQMEDNGKAIEVISLRAELNERGLLAEVGGVETLTRLLTTVPGPSHGRYYAEKVRGYAALRRLIGLDNDSLREVFAPSSSRDRALEIAETMMSRLAEIINTAASTSYRRIDDIMVDVRREMTSGGIQGIKTGFFALDDAIGEIGAGEEVIIAARPSMGKSLLAKQIALNNALDGVPFAVISLEERDAKIGRNLLAGLSGIDNHRIRKAKFLIKEEWDAIDDGIRQAVGLPLYVVDKARKVSEIRAALSVLKARHGIRGFVLDYLGRVRGVDGKGIYEQVTNASGAVSDLIKDLKLSGIVLAQLNRSVEMREDKRPNMSDLRDSGAIEQDADAVLFLHREDYYHLSDDGYTPDRVAEIIIAKMRDGERGGIVKLQSNLRLQRFENAAVPEQVAEMFQTTM